MADPTQKNRDSISEGLSKVGSFLKSAVPNSPLSQSQDSVLTPEAQAKIAEAEAIQAQAETQAANSVVSGPAPAATQADPEFEEQKTASSQPEAPKPSSPNLLNVYDQATNQLVAAEDKLGKQEAENLNSQAKIINDQVAAEQAAMAKRDADVALIQDDQKKAQEDLDNSKIEPSNFFSNKSTWQKIVGGVGLFLGSITPEGARNVASIIDKEIERDIDRQKQDYNLKKGKVDAVSNRYKAYLDKYKDDQLARYALQKEKLLATDYQLKGLQAASKGEMARGKAGMGRVEIASKLAEIEQKQLDRMSKLGSPNKAEQKGLNDMQASSDTINSSLDDLSELVKGTGESIPFTQKNDRANQLVQDVQLQLKAIKDLGVLSGDDAKRLDDYISNPSFFKSDARMQGQIKGVKDLVMKALNAQRKVLGVKDPNAVAGFKENK